MRLKGSTVTSESLLPPLTIHTHPPLVLSMLAPILGVLTATVGTAQPQLLADRAGSEAISGGYDISGLQIPSVCTGTTCQDVLHGQRSHGTTREPGPAISLPSKCGLGEGGGGCCFSAGWCRQQEGCDNRGGIRKVLLITIFPV